MKCFANFFAAVVFFAGLFGFSVQAHAQSSQKVLNLANMSHLTGLVFEDRPLLLPLERNFQMAMLAASSELGRSCGKIEAYAWPLEPSEQDRVNSIFKSTVERLKLMGYMVEAKSLKSAASDISVFTADMGNKYFVFLWSAGEYGLVMNLCQTSAPIAVAAEAQLKQQPAPALALPDPKEEALRRQAEADIIETFSPVGQWSGNYACGSEGYTGATLQVDSLKGKDFKGVFRFYATEKNPSAAEGSFEVSGQFDKETGLILINPGKWIKQPKGYSNTVMVGRFDPLKDTLGVYFEGVTGCTSFEAARALGQSVKTKTPAKKEEKKAPAKKPPAIKRAPPKQELPVALTPVTEEVKVGSAAAPAVFASPEPAAEGISLGTSH
ncbi:MAG: hypothetical protein FWF23_02020 [Alphaproteobacteria bacterium]|nr:hypothetical protein [Alphaproteobacteria bacterium]MCL2505082.1 hypothetical protein [Alphaproteobacteria bacterium]